MKACREVLFFFPSLASFLTEFRLSFSSIKKLSLLNSSVMSRSSKWDWMLQFYIVWQRCLLDMPYHKYHLFISGLPGLVRFWLKFISKELWGGLSFTAEAWQQERAVTEPSQSRPGKITTKFQWHNGQNQSSRASLCLGRWEMSSEEGRCWEITNLHHQLVSVMKKYNWFLTACWLQGVTWFRI